MAFLKFHFLIQGVKLVLQLAEFRCSGVIGVALWPFAFRSSRSRRTTCSMLSNQRPSRQPLPYSYTPGREPVVVSSLNSGLKFGPFFFAMLSPNFVMLLS